VNFLPWFERFVQVQDESQADRLRSQANAIRDALLQVTTMLQKVDPGFAASHSELHIQLITTTTTRRETAEDAIHVLNSVGGSVDPRGVIVRLRKGTCDLRALIREIRSASQLPVEPLSTADKACGIG
jgi:hypothetical protein